MRFPAIVTLSLLFSVSPTNYPDLTRLISSSSFVSKLDKTSIHKPTTHVTFLPKLLCVVLNNLGPSSSKPISLSFDYHIILWYPLFDTIGYPRRNLLHVLLAIYYHYHYVSYIHTHVYCSMFLPSPSSSSSFPSIFYYFPQSSINSANTDAAENNFKQLLSSVFAMFEQFCWNGAKLLLLLIINLLWYTTAKVNQNKTMWMKVITRIGRNFIRDLKRVGKKIEEKATHATSYSFYSSGGTNYKHPPRMWKETDNQRKREREWCE